MLQSNPKKHKTNRFIIFIPIAVVIFVVIGTIIITGSWKGSPPPEQISNQLSQPFSATANIKMKNMVMVADINKTSPQTFTFAIKQPATLKGLAFQYNGTDLNVSYKGMSVNIADDSLLAKGIAAMVIKAVNAASEETGVTMQEKDGALWIHGTNQDGDFNLKLDKQNRSLLSLDMPSLDLNCEFSNFLFQPQTTSEPSQSQNTSDISSPSQIE